MDVEISFIFFLLRCYKFDFQLGILWMRTFGKANWVVGVDIRSKIFLIFNVLLGYVDMMI